MDTRCGTVKHSMTTINVNINLMIDDGPRLPFVTLFLIFMSEREGFFIFTAWQFDGGIPRVIRTANL